MACIRNYLGLFCAIAFLLISDLAVASQYRGQVTFNALPVPGAVVIASQGAKKFVSLTDQQGLYSFADLADGIWTIGVEMQCFSPIHQDVVIAPGTAPAKWELKLLPLTQIKAQIEPTASTAPSPSPPVKREQSSTPASSNLAAEPATSDKGFRQADDDGFLINGSVNNGAASPFAQLAAFGNNRNGAKGLYNGGIGIIFDNSALDARSFSLSGQNTAKPAYNRVTGVATLGGPLKIPHLLERGPMLFVGYQWTRSRDAATQAGLVPDSAERGGDFSHQVDALGQPIQIFDPSTGFQFPGNRIPSGQISPQAQALLNFYPLPNVAANPLYNYQIPIVSNTHQEALQSRLDQTFNPKNELFGDFAFQSTRYGSPNLFGFLDTTDVLGFNAGIHWSHRLNHALLLSLGYNFSRLATRIKPYWENRENVSGGLGIAGNNQDPMNWGPPGLAFARGVSALSDAQSSFDRNQTNAWSYAMLWNRNRHAVTFGGDFRRQEFNYRYQNDPRGTFTFTGAATQGSSNGAAVGGSDVADFLLGIPDTSSVAFGNADKYFRESVYDAYVTDDWRISPEFTMNAGMRWEYGAPITELYGRLVNLDIAPGFAAVAPVIATDPVGPLTGQRYPDTLIRPDKRGLEPRVGIAWRPFPGSSMVVRAGYGIYNDTSVYQTIALQMAQQAPLSKSLNVQNSPACPLTLANGFKTCPSITPDNFAIDPNFRIGYAQNWQLAVQRDLPGSLLLTATYLGIKGTRGVQEFLPNTFPAGAVNPCPTCPAGFAYLTSNGSSTREAGQVQLRRRLHNGLSVALQYTFSKSIDDDSMLGAQGASAAAQTTPPNASSSGTVVVGGTDQSSSPSAPTVAQNWLELGAERGLSTFDRRHLLTVQLHYTTGMGLGGKTLLSGWQGVLFKEWTLATQITAGSGLPETPIFLAAVPGTGVTGTIRPDSTGAPLYRAPAGLFLNPAAYTAPLPGQWGNAGRDSIIGPAQYTLNASLGRTFRLHDRFNLDFRMDSINLLNHVTFVSWNAITNSAQFGLPTAANAMRKEQLTLRLRF
jgi:hypothetical protein